jgi:hypothetical protein
MPADNLGTKLLRKLKKVKHSPTVASASWWKCMSRSGSRPRPRSRSSFKITNAHKATGVRLILEIHTRSKSRSRPRSWSSFTFSHKARSSSKARSSHPNSADMNRPVFRFRITKKTNVLYIKIQVQTQILVQFQTKARSSSKARSSHPNSADMNRPGPR